MTDRHATTPPVYDELRRTRADLEREAALGDGLRVALWRRRELHDVLYDRPAHHTLSLYLEDGYRVHPHGRPDLCGAPGKLCLLPAGHESYWHIRGGIRFVHFYFEADALAERAVTMLDREPRSLSLDERIYVDDPVLADACRRLAGLGWQAVDDRLAANAIGHAVLAELLLRYSGRPHRLVVRGGLAPAARRRVADLIEARLATPPTLGEMARELALSEYHFAHMFRLSFGLAPHRWIMRRRLARARELLARGLPLPWVAAAAGYSHVSHLARQMRTELGVTPGDYRRWAMPRTLG